MLMWKNGEFIYRSFCPLNEALFMKKHELITTSLWIVWNWNATNNFFYRVSATSG